ncbi:MAG: four helix bundle protein, partial [Elusimicrobiota bacterium]
MIRSYKDLIVWQKSYQLSLEIYKISRKFPKYETYGLSSQICRSAVSICSNIAEGHCRKHTGEYLQFLAIASGSIGELETQLLLARDLKYVDDIDFDRIVRLLTEISKMLSTLIKSLKSKSSTLYPKPHSSSNSLTLNPKSCSSSGQVIVIFIAIVLLFSLLIPLHVHFLTQESRWTQKEKRSTQAFHCAEEGVDRGMWKMNENTNYWKDIGDGYRIPGYNFDVVYVSTTGGYYTVEITTTALKSERKITAIGKSNDGSEIRTVEIILSKSQLNAPLQAAFINNTGSSSVWWGPIMSLGDINLSGSASQYYPRKMSRGKIAASGNSKDRDLAPGVWNPGDPDGDDKDGIEWWSYNSYPVPDPPEVNFNYYRTVAQAGLTYTDPNNENQIKADIALAANKDKGVYVLFIDKKSLNLNNLVDTQIALTEKEKRIWFFERQDQNYTQLTVSFQGSKHFRGTIIVL